MVLDLVLGTRGEIKAIFSKSSLCPILKFWILKVLCDVYPKIWSPTMGLFFFNTAYRPKCRRTWFFSKDESKCAFFHSFTLVLCFLNVSSFPPACSRDVNNYLYLKIKLYPLHISEKILKNISIFGHSYFQMATGSQNMHIKKGCRFQIEDSPSWNKILNWSCILAKPFCKSSSIFKTNPNYVKTGNCHVCVTRAPLPLLRSWVALCLQGIS